MSQEEQILRLVEAALAAQEAKHPRCTDGHRWVFSHFCDVYLSVGFCVDCECYTMDIGYDLKSIEPKDVILSKTRVSQDELKRLQAIPKWITQLNCQIRKTWSLLLRRS